MTEPTLFFYDLETSGLSVLDQILSFAGIRVNMALEELDVVDLKASWRLDTLPSMSAYQVHKISIQDHQDSPSEFAMIQRVHQELNVPMTKSGGFNTLGFDDQHLRFAFSRSLLTPYTHQYMSGCARFDILPLLPFYYLFSNETLVWPKHPDGRISFKLEDLNVANQWLEGQAHEALFDVKVTLALARRLKENAPMWDYLMGYFDKSIDQKRSQVIRQQSGAYKDVGIMVGLQFGSKANYHVPVLYIGSHTVYKNMDLYLRLDLEVDLDHLQDRLVRKKAGEPGFILPFNQKYSAQLSKEVLNNLETNLKALGDQSAFETLKSFEYPKSELEIDLDAALYTQSFLSSTEQYWCNQFVKGDSYQRELLLSNPPSHSVYLRALRLMWRHFYDDIPVQHINNAKKTIQQFLYQGVDYKGKGRQDIDQLTKSLELYEGAEPELMIRHLQAIKIRL
jgi:exodeoxyribonuclease-1